MKPAGKTVPEETLAACLENNPDGWGMMFVEGGRVQTVRSMDPKRFMDAFEKYQDRSLGIHFRLRTHGDKVVDQTHPFQILSLEEHGRDLFVMHNGIIRHAPEVDKTKSDTWHYVEHVLRPILIYNPGLIEEQAFRDLVSRDISSSRLLFLDDDGTFYAANEKDGVWIGGVWFSNTYGWKKKVSYSYPGTSLYGGASVWDAASKTFIPVTKAVEVKKVTPANPPSATAPSAVAPSSPSSTGTAGQSEKSSGSGKSDGTSNTDGSELRDRLVDLVVEASQEEADDCPIQFLAKQEAGTDEKKGDEEDEYRYYQKELYDFLVDLQVLDLRDLDELTDEQIIDLVTVNPDGVANMILKLLGRSAYAEVA